MGDDCLMSPSDGTSFPLYSQRSINVSSPVSYAVSGIEQLIIISLVSRLYVGMLIAGSSWLKVHSGGSTPKMAKSE